MNAAHAKFLTMAVPRYTSYPTVPHFSDVVDAAIYAGWLSRLDPSEPLSLYLHVPFCRQLCWYCGCNMKLASREETLTRYADMLMREIVLLATKLPTRMRISHLHWGGGTPTALSPDDLNRIMDLVRQRFHVASDVEIAIESDPRTLSKSMIERIGALGFNRASFGVQEFDPKVQAAINRIQPSEMVARAVEDFRAVGVRNINFDLIYGLPHQTVETLIATIRTCAAIRPDRLSLFGYAHVPWMAKKQRLIPTEALPDTVERVKQAGAAAFELQRLGYLRVGMDHFALPEDRLATDAATGNLRRNFQGYTTDRARTLLGVGATSIGRLPDGYVQNMSETGAWARAIEEGMLPVAKGHAFHDEDRIRGHIIEQLMCFGAVDLPASLRRYGVTEQTLATEMAELWEYAREGVVTIEKGIVRVPEDARSLVRVVANIFDSYHKKQMARHSVAV